MGYVFLATIFLACILFRKSISNILSPQSPIKTLQEFYSQVDDFSRTLREQGYEEIAEKIEKAQLKGSVGSEIIGDIGLAIREVMGELPKSFVPKAKELRHFVRWHRRLLGID